MMVSGGWNLPGARGPESLTSTSLAFRAPTPSQARLPTAANSLVRVANQQPTETGFASRQSCGLAGAAVASWLAQRRRQGTKVKRQDAVQSKEVHPVLGSMLWGIEKQDAALRRFLHEDSALSTEFAKMEPKDAKDSAVERQKQTVLSNLDKMRKVGQIRDFTFHFSGDKEKLCVLVINCDGGLVCGVSYGAANPQKLKRAAAVQALERLHLNSEPEKELKKLGSEEHDGAQKVFDCVQAFGKSLRNVELQALQPCGGDSWKACILAKLDNFQLAGLSPTCQSRSEAIDSACEQLYNNLLRRLNVSKDAEHAPEEWAEALRMEIVKQDFELCVLGENEVQESLIECLTEGESEEKMVEALQAAVVRQEARLASIAEQSMVQEEEDSQSIARRTWEVTPPEEETWRIEEVKGKLPAEKIRGEISKALEYNKSLIISGGTGSGKSTQIPQFILDDFRGWEEEFPEGVKPEPLQVEVDSIVEVEFEDNWYACTILEVSDDKSTITAKYHDGGDEEGDIDVKTRVRKSSPFWARQKPTIVVTQPRRIAALSLAQRVAEERMGEVGGEIGHAIRGDAVFPDAEEGTVEFCTVGTLLRRVMSDPLLRRYNVVILDEVHERDLFTDYLLILMKEVLARRPDIRLVVMSATLDVSTFVNYLPGSQVVEVPTGTRYPVEEIHINDPYFGEFLETKALLLSEEEGRQNLGGGTGGKSHEFGAMEELDEMQNEEEEKEEEEGEEEAAIPSAVLVEQIQQLAGFSDEINEAWKVTKKEHSEPPNEWEPDRLLAFLDSQNIRPWKVDLASWQVTSSAPWWGSQNNDKTVLRLMEKTILSVLPDMEEVAPDDEIGRGSVLCFLPGWGEIKEVARTLEEGVYGSRMTVLKLHSSVTKEEQQLVFEPVREGTVKIILSTNIAESSVTINDVRVVIDSGLHREVTYDPKKRLSQMETVWICQSNAVQRKGRAGRVRSGKVYRLYSKDQFESLPWRPAPELQRANLAQTCLQTVSLGRDPREFLAKAPDPPMVGSLESAMSELANMEAIKDGFRPSLLPLGQVLSRMPLEPLLGRAMVLGALFGIPQMTAALLTVAGRENPFLAVKELRAEVRVSKMQFCSWSDTIGALRALTEFERVWKERGERVAEQWCQQFMLNKVRLMVFSRIKFQLLRDVERSGLTDAASYDGEDPEEWMTGGEEGAMWEEESQGALFNASEITSGLGFKDWSKDLQESEREVEDERLLVGMLCFAFPGNIAVRERPEHKLHLTSLGEKALIGRASVNAKQKEENRDDSWLPSPSMWLYGDMRMFNGQFVLSDTTYLSGWNMALFSSLKEEEKDDSVELNGWIGVRGESEEITSLVRTLRKEINRSLVWVCIAASWDRVALAALQRSKTLLQILGDILLGNEPSTEDLAFVKDWRLPEVQEDESALAAGEEISREEVEESLWTKTVVELKVLLREMGAKVSGRKADLVGRCADCLMYGAEQEIDADAYLS